MINLETIPLREVPTYGLFIYQLNDAFLVYRKTGYRARAVLEYAMGELIYSTRTHYARKGKPHFFDDDCQVAYTGIIFKDRRE